MDVLLVDIFNYSVQDSLVVGCRDNYLYCYQICYKEVVNEESITQDPLNTEITTYPC